jgi:hypothetical protein
MKTFSKVLASVIAVLTLVVQTPAVQQFIVAFFTSHPTVSTVLGGLGAILAIFHVPTADPAK